MQPLPKDFLEAVAREYGLSPGQTEALIKLVEHEGDVEEAASALYIGKSTLSTRMTYVYEKFSFRGRTPNKFQKLHKLLLEKYESQHKVSDPIDLPEPDIDALVQEVRRKVYDDIHHRCGTMRVLDMEQPIGIDDIYTSVNILEKLSGRRRLGIDELLQDCDLENFDRFMLGQVRHERVPGLEAVERYDKLMILGKPGAGKTTFMKRLATLCNQGEFQAQRVPVFVTLKEFSDKQGKPGLQAFIAQQWNACGVSDAESVKAVLDQGSALVLLDGLDEVQEADHDRVLQEIKSFTGRFRQCQFVMTCRIAAREYTFQQFTEVEVADFNQEQIEDFATKWFKTKQDPEKGENFIKRLGDNKPIQELATNPLLLTLLCLVFGDGNDFPSNRAELYKEGLDVLLKKWDAKRNIERDQVYKKLSLKRKEDLLSQLAFKTFEQGDYFFKQAVIEQHITEYICNLTETDDDEALQFDGEAVLKSIESQHGLLVERAKNIYSFSHLTFQEYFTAKYISNPTTQLDYLTKELARKIAIKRYREVSLLVTQILPKADFFILELKDNLNRLSRTIPLLEDFINWIYVETGDIDSPPNKNLRRAIYFSIYSCNGIGFRPEDDFFSCLRELKIFHIDFAFAKALYDESKAPKIILNHAISHINRITHQETMKRFLLSEENYSLDLNKGLHVDLDTLVSCSLMLGLDNFSQEMKALKDSLPNFDQSKSEFGKWWKKNSGIWVNDFRCKIKGYLNISDAMCRHILPSNSFEEPFSEFKYAVRLLMSCLNSDCYVTKTTRQYIEDTLLLPMSEIEKYERPTV